MAARGGRLSYLLSVAKPDFYPHYTHGLYSLFRFGGCIPAIRVKADLEDTLLLGAQRFWEGGGMLVRTDDGIRRTEDLGGRRVGLSRSLNATKADYRRVTEERGIELLLRLHCMRRDDLRIVDCPFPDDWYEGPGMTEPLPDLLDFWRAYGVQADMLQQPELEAGVIDACFVTDPFRLEYADCESVRLVGSLASQPDRTVQVGGAPYALTAEKVSTCERGDISHDFDMDDWAAPEFLAAAPRGLHEDT